MSQDAVTEHTSSLARMQMRLFGDVGASARLTAEQQRALLELSDQEWTAWQCFLCNGPLPARPGLPEMLVRIGAALHRLAVASEDSPGQPPRGSRVSADAAGW